MAHKLKEADWESYYLCENAFGVVPVHVYHVPRVAQLLAERHKGIIFIWMSGTSSTMICAVKPDKRKTSRSVEEKIVNAGEHIAENVAKKHPVRPRLLGWLRGKPRIKSGWHFEPA
jgi:hypothetical protein